MCNNFYPRVHYPEVYILAGGYAAMYKAHPVSRLYGLARTSLIRLPVPQEQCDPNGYRRMNECPDYPRAMDEFRRRSALARTRSFTFGDTITDVPSSKAVMEQPKAITEDEHENSGSASSAAGSSSPGEIGDSPCPGKPAPKARLLKGHSFPIRMPMGARASTCSTLNFQPKVEQHPFI